MPEVVERKGGEADFTFKAGDLTVDDLKVTAFEGREGLSELFHFRVALCSDLRDVAFEQVVGKPCLLEIAGPSGSRYVSGIVRSFARTREGAALTHYAAEVVPKHWLLTKRMQSRTYLPHNCPDMTVPGIVKQVLQEAGIPEDSCRWALSKTDYAEREFVVQYRESDFDFISRLMEHEGIFYFFEHTADGHKMVFGDSPVAHAENPLAAEFPYRDPKALSASREYVFAALDREEIQFGAVCLEDFNFKKPPVELRAELKAETFTDLHFSDFPGEYDEKEVGAAYAQVRLEEAQAARREVRLEATVRVLTPGFKFTLTEHPAEAMNREYVVTHVAHRATQGQSGEAEQAGGQTGTAHQTEIRAIPSDVPYRPPRKTRRPVIVGTQSALVTGPKDEEIYTDDEGYGRIKVQFHWDLQGRHDENSSAWVRVLQGLAGGNYGMIFLPRVGQEVLVAFLEGNPDRPVVVGGLYNNDNMPPYKLPDEKTKSTIKTNSSTGSGGFNELRFEDKKDEEQIFLHAQKNLDVRVKEDKFETIERDYHLIVKRDFKQKFERDAHVTFGKDHCVKVAANDSLTVGGNQAASVTGTYELQAANVTIMANGNLTLQASGVVAIKGASVIIEGGAAVNVSGGGGAIAVAGGTVATGPMTAVCIGPGVVTPVPGSGAPPPPVPAPPAVAMGPTSPTDPEEAATGDPGQDTTYEQEEKEFDPVQDGEIHDESESDAEQRHWIGIRLLDDNGEPIVGERYAIVLPDGTTVASGRLNHKGEAEVRGLKDAGNCQVTFPDLDELTWKAGPPPGGAGGGGAGGVASGAGAPGVPGGGGLPSLPV